MFCNSPRMSGLALALASSCAVSVAHAQPDYDALVPGEWTVVSSNTVDDVDPCPASDCSYSAVEGVSAVIDDWCGGAFASGYGELGGLVLWGGGHNGYFGSEVYAFDLGMGTWARVSEPYDDGSGSVAAACNDDGVYPDGSACPAHTYDRVDYDPATNRFVILSGTPDPVCGGCDDNRVHFFDLDDATWSLGARRPVPGSVTGATSAYDETRGVFWFLPTYTQPFASYDPGTDTWTDHGSPQVTEIDGNAVRDPVRDLFVFVDARGSHRTYAIPLDAPDTGLVALTTTGDTEIESVDKLGFDWDPVSERFVAWADGSDVFVLNPPAGDWRTAEWVWARVPAAATNTVTPAVGLNGTYSRFRYAATVNTFVLVSTTDGPVWAYRLSPGTGTGPMPRPDGGPPAMLDGGGRDGGGTATADGGPVDPGDEGCGCSTVGARPRRESSAIAASLLALVLIAWRRRRGGPRACAGLLA